MKSKNKIITISGEPVSGKGTTVKMLIAKLKEQGYTDEQIHLQTTGHEFRKYFNSVVELVVNIDNEEKLNELIKRPELKKFFENDEYRKLLSKTIANLKESNVDLSHFTIEQANNGEEFKDIRNVVDSLLDNAMKEKGEEINSEEHPDDIWIIDSRLAFANIPGSFSIRLTTNPRIAGERLFNDKSRGDEDSDYATVEEAIKEREERRIGEKSRYKYKYDIDLEDENNYNLIIDTSYSKVSDIADIILECADCYYADKKFGKKWASPKIFLPLQPERETFASTFLGLTMEELEEEIKKDGYYPDSVIEVINVDDVKYIIEGHHRNFAMAHAGKTLIPYEVIASNDEIIPGTQNTARNRAESAKLHYLYGHEDIFENFSYSEIYPDIYRRIEELQGEAR